MLMKTLGQARRVKGDRQGAIASLEKALELDPQSAQIRNELQAMKAP
jgi:cytochrome c-type biogenesis protein CcmH/NrfG